MVSCEMKTHSSSGKEAVTYDCPISRVKPISLAAVLKKKVVAIIFSHQPDPMSGGGVH